MGHRRRCRASGEQKHGFAIQHPVPSGGHLTPMPNPDLIENTSYSRLMPSAKGHSCPAKESHPLDNPIWNSLLTEHSTLTVSNRLARRYPAAIGPLSGIAEQSDANYEALRILAGPGGVVVLFCAEPPTPPEGWTLIRGGLLTQMVCEEPSAGAAT